MGASEVQQFEQRVEAKAKKEKRTVLFLSLSRLIYLSLFKVFASGAETERERNSCVCAGSAHTIKHSWLESETSTAAAGEALIFSTQSH